MFFVLPPFSHAEEFGEKRDSAATQTTEITNLPKYLNPRERLALRCLVGLIMIALVFVGIRFYERNVEILPDYGGELVEALIGQPQYINPVLAFANEVDEDLTKLLFVGLYQTDQNGAGQYADNRDHDKHFN